MVHFRTLTRRPPSVDSGLNKLAFLKMLPPYCKAGVPFRSGVCPDSNCPTPPPTETKVPRIMKPRPGERELSELVRLGRDSHSMPAPATAFPNGMEQLYLSMEPELPVSLIPFGDHLEPKEV